MFSVRSSVRRLAVVLVASLAVGGLAMGSTHAAAGGTSLTAGQTLSSGQQLANGPDTLLMQADGNLVEYGTTGVALWASNTYGHSGAYAIMQADGNLVVYLGGTALWASGTSGHAGAYVLLQADGNVVIYSGGTALWASNSWEQSYALTLFPGNGWGSNQWPCLNALWIRESGWNPYATNPSSGAYGIPQALPASKMAAAGSDWKTNADTQIRWGESYYIQPRYGTPCTAWSHEVSYGWYSVKS